MLIEHYLKKKNNKLTSINISYVDPTYVFVFVIDWGFRSQTQTQPSSKSCHRHDIGPQEEPIGSLTGQGQAQNLDWTEPHGILVVMFSSSIA